MTDPKKAAAAAVTLKLSPELEAVLKALATDDRTAYNALPSDEHRLQTLEFILEQQAMAATTIDDAEFEIVAADDGGEDIPVYASGKLGCAKGTIFKAIEFLGTMPMFSFEFKENWDREKAPNGKTFYRNHYYLFKNPKTGKRFGLFKAPCLNKVLPKLPTMESAPSVVKVNPLINIEYVGMVEGRDVLADKYDLKITTGNQAHVHIVAVQRDVKWDRYRRGVVNYLRNPIPNLGEEAQLDALGQAEKDWDQLEMLNGNTIVGNAALEAPAARV